MRQTLLDELVRRHGPMWGRLGLAAALGHRSAASLRQTTPSWSGHRATVTLPKGK